MIFERCEDMQDNRDEFTSTTRELLGRRVGYRCSNPYCRKLTCGAGDAVDDYVSIGVAAHICAAASGGPRYDADMTPEMRKDIQNGIWLCQSCSRLIDRNETRYTVDVLNGWKKRAERESSMELERSQSMNDFLRWLQPMEDELVNEQDLHVQIEYMYKVCTSIDELVEKLEHIQSKVDQAIRNGDMKWQTIYQTQFDNTLFMLNQLNRESDMMRRKAQGLKNHIAHQLNLAQSAGNQGLPVAMVIDVSGSMGGCSTRLVRDERFYSDARELVCNLREKWTRAVQIEESVERTFWEIDRMELELLDSISI